MSSRGCSFFRAAEEAAEDAGFLERVSLLVAWETFRLC